MMGIFGFFKKEFEDLSPEEFKRGIETNPNAVLLDVRTPMEYQEDHIKGSVLLDFHDPQFEKKVQQLDMNKAYYVYCRSGGRSSSVCTILKRMGIKEVYNLRGGILAWRRFYPHD